jgi:predicted RNA-binding protein with PIN domain
LLHNWPEQAPGKPRHAAAARDELIHRLTRYYDATGTPITISYRTKSSITTGRSETNSINGVNARLP